MPQVAVAAALTVAQIVISRLLAGKKPDVNPRTESSVLLVDSVAPRQKIYGHQRTAGSIVAARSHPSGERDHFTYVTALADHTSEGMTHVWIDKDRLEIGVDLQVNGNIYDSGTAQGGAQRVEEPYDPENNFFGNQEGYIILRSGASSTDNEYAGMTVEITGNTGVGQSETITSYDGALKRAFIAGFWSTVPDNTSEYEVKVEVTGWEDWLTPVKDSPKGDKYLREGEPLFGCKIYLGGQTTADTRLVNIDPGNWWGTDYVGENVTYAGVTWKTDAELGFGARMPEIRFEGDYANDIYDWRTGTTGYTNNAVLCLADWLLWEHGPFQRLNASWAKVGLDDTNFVSAEMIAEANIADEAVMLKDGVSTQPRYTVDGIVSADDSPEEVFGKFFLMLGGGMLVRRADQMFVRAGADRSPVMALTEKNIAYGPNRGVVTRPRHSARERFNTVEGEYFDARPASSFERTTYPPVSLTGFLTDDGGRREMATVDFEFCTNHERAQRLARIQLLRHRSERTVTVPLTFTGGEPPGSWRLEVGDVVTLDRDVYGGVDEFWVQHARGLEDGLTELTLREYTDFWLEAPDDAEDVEQADEADLWDGRIDDVTGLAATTVPDSEGVRPGGQLTVQMALSCNEHPNSIVRRQGSYRFRWRHISQTAWRGATSDEPEIVAPNLVVDQRYQMQARAEVNTGSVSAKSLWAPNPPLFFDATTSEFPLPGPPGTGSHGENRVPNPIYAHGLSGWATDLMESQDVDLSLVSGEGRFGTNAAKLTRVDNTDPQTVVALETVEPIKCQHGERVRHRFAVKRKGTFNALHEIQLSVDYYDKDDVFLENNGLDTVTAADMPDDTWVFAGSVHTVPRGDAVFFRLRAWWSVAALNEPVYFDGWMARQILSVNTTVVTGTDGVNGFDDGSGGVWEQARSVPVGKPGDTVFVAATLQTRVAATSAISQVGLRLRLIRYDADGVSNPLVIEGPHADYMLVEPGSLYVNYKPEGAATALGYETPFTQVTISGSDVSDSRGEFVYKVEVSTTQPNGRAQFRHRGIVFALE